MEFMIFLKRFSAGSLSLENAQPVIAPCEFPVSLSTVSGVADSENSTLSVMPGKTDSSSTSITFLEQYALN